MCLGNKFQGGIIELSVTGWMGTCLVHMMGKRCMKNFWNNCFWKDRVIRRFSGNRRLLGNELSWGDRREYQGFLWWSYFSRACLWCGRSVGKIIWRKLSQTPEPCPKLSSLHSGVLGGKLCDYFTRIFFLLKGTPE